jgi:hypothetical protein
MRQALWVIVVFTLFGACPARTAVVANAQQEPNKDGKPPPEKVTDAHYAKIEIVGVLTDSVGIDSQFRGWLVSTKKIQCYLDFQENKDLLKFAAQHDGKTVTVTGSVEFPASTPPSTVMYVRVKVATMQEPKKAK